MKEQIDYSNNQAAKNRNFYPIQEQATQMELWEYVPCTCEETCTCKKFGCTYHWKLKKDVQFDHFVCGFLRMFVDRYQHQPVIDALNRKDPAGLNTRAIGAFYTLLSLKNNWAHLSNKAADHNKTLFCDGWADESFRNLWSFSVQGTSIYQAKQYCVLFPDICVPYDTASRLKMMDHFGIGDSDYFAFLTVVRQGFQNCMMNHHLSLPSLRTLDSPQNQLPFDSFQISLPRPGMDYGTAYLPKERQISIVLDKCFYQPTRTAITPPSTKKISLSERTDSGQGYQIKPLSGTGETITVHPESGVRLVKWGNLKFRLPDAVIQKILEQFFIRPDQWYLLGASMTAPDPEGLGSFIRKNFSSFTPRHASAIAAIMVHENLLEYRGMKPIFLKKRRKNDTSEIGLHEENNA